MMHTKFLTLTFATLLGGAALIGPAVVAPALAEDVVVEHYDEDTGGVVTTPDGPVVVEEEDGPMIVEEHPASPPTRYEPPVYGWISVAPANCGTFKYWNGERCADARFGPED
jgi:hypothetical protein